MKTFKPEDRLFSLSSKTSLAVSFFPLLSEADYSLRAVLEYFLVCPLQTQELEQNAAEAAAEAGQLLPGRGKGKGGKVVA